VYEGFIDLVAWLEDGPLIVDWKTDRLAPDAPLSELADRYGPQLAVYRRATTAMWGVEARACLFSTVRGQTIS